MEETVSSFSNGDKWRRHVFVLDPPLNGVEGRAFVGVHGGADRLGSDGEAADVVARLSRGEVASERLEPIYLREHDGAKARAGAAALP